MKHQININGQTGAGLASVASALASAGVEVSPARRAMGAECMTLRQCLESCERPAGPLLQAVQAQMDLELCELQLRRLNQKMVGDGRESLWLRDAGRGAGWATTGTEAIADAVQALALWRAGVSLVRDDSGADVVSVGDEWGTVSAVWALRGAGKYRLQATAARVAYRAVSGSVSADTFGDTQGTPAAAVDWCEWYQFGGAARTAAELLAQWRAAHQQKRRLATLQARCDTLASGRGRRAAVVAKVQHWALLVLGGMDCESAAAAAGFKGRAATKGGGAVSASLRVASALRRMGLRVSAKRGAWAQMPDEWEQAKRRGAAADLAALFAFHPDQINAGLPGLPALPAAGRWCGAACLMAARVRSVWRSADALQRRHGRRAAGVLPAAPAPAPAAPAPAGPSVDCLTLPASAVTLRRAVRAWERRKLRGVIKARPAASASGQRAS